MKWVIKIVYHKNQNNKIFLRRKLFEIIKKFPNLFKILQQK